MGHAIRINDTGTMATSKDQIAGNDLCRLIHIQTVFSFVLNLLTDIYLNID